jgi:hypothetical protein
MDFFIHQHSIFMHVDKNPSIIIHFFMMDEISTKYNILQIGYHETLLSEF